MIRYNKPVDRGLEQERGEVRFFFDFVHAQDSETSPSGVPGGSGAGLSLRADLRVFFKTSANPEARFKGKFPRLFFPSMPTLSGVKKNNKACQAPRQFLKIKSLKNPMSHVFKALY